MEPSTIPLDQCLSGIMHVYHKTTEIFERIAEAWHLQCFKYEPIYSITTVQYHPLWNFQISYNI